MSRCSFLPTTHPGPLGYVASTFTHARGIAEVHYFPPRNDKTPRDIIVFFPGNPGLINYYTPFLLNLQSHLSSHYAFLAHSHLGHSPSLPHPTPPLKLYEQVDSKVEFITSLAEELSEIRLRQEGGQGDESQLRPVRISLIGHSVGAEIAIQTMRRLDDRLETSGLPDHKIPKQFEMNASLLLFPTIAHIAQTPNGRKLRPIFHAPLIHLLPVLCYLIHPLIQVVRLVLSLVPTSTSTSGTTRSSIYAPNATTLRFLSSPTTVKHVLHLAQSEMVRITRPDLAWYESNASRLWSYWGKEDGWVGRQGDEVKHVLRGGDRVVVDDHEGEDGVTGAIRRVVDCVDSVPHAFCLAHSDVIAAKVARWIEQAHTVQS